MPFRLLQSIFSGATQPGKFDKELMLRGIERVVDGTDPRLRAVSHYRASCGSRWSAPSTSW